MFVDLDLQIRIGMELIKEACANRKNCDNCPFDLQCDALSIGIPVSVIDTPSEWEDLYDCLSKD
jgi:hypothetical protein